MFWRQLMLASRLVWFAFVASACGASMTGVLDANGYKHSTYDYRVMPVAPTGALLPDGWMLDNLYGDSSQPGKPMKPKESSAYMTTYRFDTNGDGTTDGEEKALVYDLRYQHRVHSGIIWLRSVPLSQSLRDKELRVLMQEYVDDVAGAGYEIVNLDRADVVEKRFAPELLSREEGTLGGTPVFVAEFAVANVDQVHVSEGARRRRVRVAIARPGFAYQFKPRGSDVGGATYPVLVIAGYASLPEDFARGVTDYEGLLKRIAFNGKTGLALKSLESPKASASGASKGGAADAPPEGAPKDVTVAPAKDVSSPETDPAGTSMSPAP
jgi:hypothetical protein